MKRYCQTLDLYDDKELIEAYVAEHAHVWEEVKAGIREVGIVDMQIYIYGNRLFMIMDTTDEFDMERDYARLATLPRQAEWEEHMSKYQKVLPGQTSQEKWKLMERIFKLLMRRKNFFHGCEKKIFFRSVFLRRGILIIQNNTVLQIVKEADS